MNKILIIGKLPPPIGGVTIHIQRLLGKLETTDLNFGFISLSYKKILQVLFLPLKYKTFHLHTSNVYLQLIFSIYSRIFNKRSLITYHGDLDRYNGLKHRVALLSLKLCTFPIVLNDGSLKVALMKNKNARKYSAFIPPINENKLPYETISSIDSFKKKYIKIYSTNAYNFTIDSNGQEIYGILDLIYFFNMNNEYGLVISDPSNAYYTYIKKYNISINQNILILNFPHSFCEVLKLSDGSIRNTSTDGDSLSIKESLYFGKLTFATDVVSRESGVITYKRGNYNIFLQKLITEDIDRSKLDGSIDLIKLYNRQ